ncbi:MAG: chemotaxis protein CheX [Anaeromyxobacteraceae bacterium]
MSPFGPRQWLEALEREFAAFATGALGLARVEVTARGVPPPRAMEGAYLGLVAAEGGCQIGLAATAAGCETLARALLSLPAEEPISAADVADAVCEIVNMLAGGVQRRARAAAGLQVTLGLPTFFHGTAQPTERLGVVVTEVRVGDWPAALLVLHPRRHAAEET